MSRDWMKVYSDATTLSVADAARFDIELEKRPDDLELRIQRLSYLRNNDLPWSEERVWLTKRHPEVRLGGFGYVAREHEPEAYDAIRAAWEVHLAREPDNLLFVQHASEFFGFGDLERADTLLRRGALAEPTNPMWVSSLAHVFMRRSRRETDEAARSAFALEALTHFERAHRLNPHVHLRHVELVHVAQAAIASRVYERATSAANELLAECDTYKGWWLHGNSVHHANIVLGQVALAAGDLDEAARRQPLPKADFKSPFQSDGVQRPLGEEPMLVSELNLGQGPQNALVLQWRDAQGKSLTLQLERDLSLAVLRLLEAALARAEWGVALTGPVQRETPPDAETPSPLLN